MRAPVQTSSRPRRRSLGLTVALLTLAGMAVAGCSDDGPSSPAISGNSPDDVSVPTVPTTTETTVPGTTAGADTTTTTAAP
ncbi:MAG: hypothetical protein ABW310_00765 [Acidimicrobiales bacterium]